MNATEIADRLLFERGELHPLDFLIAFGALDELDHAAWSAGRIEHIESALICPVNEAIEALRHARAYVLSQGLSPQPLDLDTLGGRSRIGSSALAELCSSRFVGAHAQRDLFRDSALAIAEQSACAALGEHRFEEVPEALRRIESAGGNAVPFRCLLDAARAPPATPKERLRELRESLVPLARRTLGEHARAYLAPLWKALARQLHGTCFSPGLPELHATYALAQAGDWGGVIEAALEDSNWDELPILVARVAEAHARLANRETARRLWTRLCWEHPDDAASLIAGASGDPYLGRRWREFIELDPELPTQDFPAWLLIADLRQRELVPASCAPSDAMGAAYAAVHALLTDHDDMRARRIVNHYNRDLLQHYLRRRRPGYG